MKNTAEVAGQDQLGVEPKKNIKQALKTGLINSTRQNKHLPLPNVWIPKQRQGL